jgi:hypothetical protein
MNKTKNLLILIIIFIVLLATYFLWQNIWQSKSNQPQEQNLNLGNLDHLQKIEISKATTTTILEKINNNWQVTSEDNAPANSQLVNNLIEGLKTIKSGLLISANPDKQATFSLTAETAMKLKLTDQSGQVLAELLIGKPDYPNTERTYVRLANSDSILLIEGNIYRLSQQANWKQPPPTANSPEPNPTPSK